MNLGVSYTDTTVHAATPQPGARITETGGPSARESHLLLPSSS